MWRNAPNRPTWRSQKSGTASSEGGGLLHLGCSSRGSSRKSGRCRNRQSETSITRSDNFWPGKANSLSNAPGQHRSPPTAAIDCCVLASTVRPRFRGLIETLQTLRRAGIKFAGAGETTARAGRARLLAGGVAPGWPRSLDMQRIRRRAGMWAVGASSPRAVTLAIFRRKCLPQPSSQSDGAAEDLVIFSVHWGSNWGGPMFQMKHFARGLINLGGRYCRWPFVTPRSPLGSLQRQTHGPPARETSSMITKVSRERILSRRSCPNRVSDVNVPTGELVRLRVPLQIFRFSACRDPPLGSVKSLARAGNSGQKLTTGDATARATEVVP